MKKLIIACFIFGAMMAANQGFGVEIYPRLGFSYKFYVWKHLNIPAEQYAKIVVESNTVRFLAFSYTNQYYTARLYASGTIWVKIYASKADVGVYVNEHEKVKAQKLFYLDFSQERRKTIPIVEKPNY